MYIYIYIYIYVSILYTYISGAASPCTRVKLQYHTLAKNNWQRIIQLSVPLCVFGIRVHSILLMVESCMTYIY